MSFHVGQQVVCVNAAETNSWNLRELVEGGIYTIRWTDGPDVRLVEQTFRTRFGLDSPFDAARFRPLVERKTSIAVFTEMLKRWEVPA